MIIFIVDLIDLTQNWKMRKDYAINDKLYFSDVAGGSVG